MMNKPLALQIQERIDEKTKPLGALGDLESLALQIASAQNTLSPVLTKPHILVFAGSHGLAASGVSAYPTEVTPQMVLNFLGGGAAINVFSKQHDITLQVIDAGVDYDFGPLPQLIDAKIARGTRNCLHEPAMTNQEYHLGLQRAADLVAEVAATGCNVIGFGEMGIGNTSAAALIMSKLLNLPLADCVGRGTGLSPEQVASKIAILQKALTKHLLVPETASAGLQTFGGYEMLMICGGMMEAARLNMLVLVDGFIASVAYLCAVTMMPALQSLAIFCHQSEEKGHRLLLEHLGAKPLLSLNMRLGEGTGCAVAFPLLQSSVAFFNEMASFEHAGVSSKTP